MKFQILRVKVCEMKSELKKMKRNKNDDEGYGEMMTAKNYDGKCDNILRKKIKSTLIKDTRTIPSDVTSNCMTLDENLGDDILSLELKYLLKKNNINSLFPVQYSILDALYRCKNISRDLMISAPTGSGKTLAYVLPIIDSIKKRKLCYLKALVIVPTKDLVKQVKKVFEEYSSSLNIKIIGLYGGGAKKSETFKEEGKKLINGNNIIGNICGSVDVIISTPGRITDHLMHTKGFHLNYLEWLVLDEFDRLLNQDFNDFMNKVNEGIALKYENELSKSFNPFLDSSLDTANIYSCKRTIKKLLFSATLTLDPEKLTLAHLVNPQLLCTDSSIVGVTNGEYFCDSAFPSTLTQSYLICSSIEEKPLYLIHLMNNIPLTRTLVFTKSVYLSTTILVPILFAMSIILSYFSHNVT